ncbi:microtubule-associated protein futsch-like [Stegastes partitus]|uniref:Microtubule-associated protein futsch-like n=1 Tax=Stegastes partitus TaxID=144197 RepID=A0A3B5A1P3_9TELE|nr:PREDICTED: microtubule-associated protein futsch-like [Stegastes partitus]
MAEEGSVYELEGLEKQLQTLLSRYSSDELRADGGPFCSDFCKLVEEFASRWQVPLPQLRILEIALRYFARASIFCTSNCDHVLHTLSSLALSVFELLLFFDQKDFHQEPLKHFTVTFQECHSALAKHQNVHLLQVESLVRGGGPWANPALQAILSESSLPQNEVDGCIGSELPVFFELRVRYLLSCERISEAVALAQCCARHPAAGQHSFFLQVYLTWLHKTSQHDRLVKEVADLSGKDAVHLICSLECEEKDELLLALSTTFLSQQLHRGDMYYLCELVFVWTKLHSRLKTSKQTLLKESHQLMLSAANVNSIFPFIRAILQEVGEDAIQFCVELCANALDSRLPCDALTKSLIYKTIAGLLPNDLEVCRACALLVFFLERSVESYKVVYLLYMHPDQEYHVDHSPIGNNVRFETLQILKKDLYFDPEFWNLIALRTNCVKLMSEKVVSAALEEIMEDKWISSYFAKEPALRSRASACQKRSKSALQAKKRHGKEDTDAAAKRLKVGSGKKKGSRPLKDASSGPLRRSFWQLDRLQDNGEHRRTTRLSEKNPPKRRIRRPKWLLEDSGTLEENNGPLRIKKHGLKHEKHHQSSVMRRSEAGQIKNKPSVNSHLKAKENNNKHHKEFASDCSRPSASPQVVLELSLPDNELLGTFTEDACNRHRGFPQVLLYKPTVKIPATSQHVKPVHRKEVVLRARDAAMFVQQLHCYARRQKGKGNGLNVQGSVSTITRSSVQGSPPKDPPREEVKGGIVLRATAARDAESPVLDKVIEAQSTKVVTRKTSSARELPEKSAVEMKVTVASQRSPSTKLTKSPVLNKPPQSTKVNAGSEEVPNGDQILQSQTVASAGEQCEEPAVEMKVTIASQSPVLDKVSKASSVEDVAKADASQTSTADKSQKKVTDKIPPISNKANVSTSGAPDPAVSGSPEVVLRGVEQVISEMDVTTSEGHVPCKNDTSPRRNLSKRLETEAPYTSVDQDSMKDISALTLVTEMVTGLAPEQLARDLENDKQRAPGSSASKDSRVRSKPKAPHRTRTTSGCSVQEREAADVQGTERNLEIDPDAAENSELMETQPESEESRLEYCCTFCNKVFKGSRVVAHAMFHYRKDECMFCGTMFKDDLLAMMHLSDHIEKLKRSKEFAGNQAQENGISDAKDISTPKTSAKAKTTNMSSGCRSRGRPRKSDVCPNSVTLPDPSLSESRKLRSNDKPAEGPSLQETQNGSKHLHSKTAVHKVNGHIGKKRELDRSRKTLQQEVSQGKMTDGAVNPRLQEDTDSSATSVQVGKMFASSTEEQMKETESLQVLKAATKQNGKVAEEKNVEPQEKVSCPADGCSWFTDLSKNRVALLYHALEDHYGDVKPLKLAFRVGNRTCSVCMRVLWSFEHFQHHVERHRLAPRHPCPHQGCTARFKSGMEMRRHARKHSPLQAVCCLPGCSQLFICLWALNLHEREHYASKSTKPDTNSNVKTSDKHTATPTGKKQHQSSKGTPTAANKTESIKATWRLREQTTHDSQGGKRPKASPPSTGTASLIKQELKEKNKSKDSNVLKNLSNKDTSAKPVGPNLRLRQTSRKDQVTNTTLPPPKIHKVISSSLLKHSGKLRQKLKKNQVNTKGLKRRGRPPKSKKAVDDENTTETVEEKASLQKNQNQPSATETDEAATASKRLKVEEEQSRPVQEVAKTTTDKSKSKNAASKQMKRNHVKQKGINTPSNSLKQSNSELKSRKLNAVKIRKWQKIETRSAPSDSSKSQKHTTANGKVSKKTTKKSHPKQEADVPPASNQPAAAQQVEAKAEAVESSPDGEEKVKVEHTDSTLNNSGSSELSVQANGSNVPAADATAADKLHKVKKEERPKKLHITEKGKTASSNSGKAIKKHKDAHKKGDKQSVKEKRPCKDEGKASGSKKREKCDVQRQSEAKAAAASVENIPNEDGKEEKEASGSPGPSIPAVTDTVSDETCPLANPEGKKVVKKEKTKNATKKTDQSKVTKKRKDVHKDDGAKVVKKRCRDGSVPSASKKPEVQPLAEAKAGVGESSEGVKTPPTAVSGPGYSLIVNGQASSEDGKRTVREALAQYSKKPYMRLPPTAYLDEKYITMPKRRKEMLFFQQRSAAPEQACTTAAALQRQRCANCFASFSSAEELQGHLQLQKCSNLFGFDSDDEGNS